MNVNIDEIVELDRINMGPIIAKSGGEFLPLKRKNKLIEELSNNSIILTHYQDTELAGYVQYIPRDNGEYYVLSIQVHSTYRNGSVLRALLKLAANDLLKRKPLSLTSSVHKGNKPSISLHERLGFLIKSKTSERINFAYTGAKMEGKLNRLSGQ